MYHWAGEMTQNLYLSFNLPYGFNDWIINFTINTWKSILIVLKELYWRVDYWINWDGEVQKHALNLEDSHNPKCQLQRTPTDLNILCVNSIGLFNVGIYMSQKSLTKDKILFWVCCWHLTKKKTTNYWKSLLIAWEKMFRFPWFSLMC